MTYLLDTNVCIDALKRRPPEVAKRLEEVPPRSVAISVITLLELRQGAELSAHRVKNHQVIDGFLSSLTVLPFEHEAALEAARIRALLQRQGNRIGDLDSLIAAHARALDLILVTNNLWEFERVPGLKIENWVQRSSI